MGAVTGLALAFFYRAEGPERVKYSWEDDDDNEQDGYSDSDSKNEELKPES
jgi:hypothetical protein